MSRENQRTIEIYEEYADKYLAGNRLRMEHESERIRNKRAKLKKLIQETITGLPEDAVFFEIGSGDGSDVELFSELGVEIIPSDAPKSFVDIMKQKGLNPIQFNALQDAFPGQYDYIYSLRVLVHFTAEDTKLTLRKVYEALRPGGRYFFNVLNSAGHDNLPEAWVDFPGDYEMGVDRYFKYWREDEISTLIENTGFQIRKMFEDGGEDNKRWFYIVAEKPKEK